MAKKLILACMAVVALAAFALPASAFATNDPQLTGPGLLPTGTTIVGTNSGNTLFTTTAAATLVECTTVKMTGTLTKNSASTVEGEIPTTGTSFAGTGAVNADNGLAECTGSFGNAYITVNTTLCLRSTPAMVTDEFQVTGGACGTGGKVQFTIGSTTAGACKYEATGPIQGDYTTNGEQASLTTRDTSAGSGSKLISGGFLCPSSGALAMTFKLETSGGTKITIS